jgi:hypothetical protein
MQFCYVQSAPAGLGLWVHFLRSLRDRYALTRYPILDHLLNGPVILEGADNAGDVGDAALMLPAPRQWPGIIS